MLPFLAARVFLVFCLEISMVTAIPSTYAARQQNASTAPKQCSLPDIGEKFQSALPAEVNIDQAAVDEAIAYATTHGRISIQIFRHNCRIATGPLDLLTDEIPNNVFSVTKSVISMIAGIAYDRNLLALDDPIGKYLPNEPGWGDAAHRALTIKELLTETSGLNEAILSETATVATDASIPQEALGEPFKYTPGTTFDYSQRVPDLVSFVVQQAVGEDIQTFAQKNLFDPIGIPSDSFFWLRDRSGDTYGYAFLFMPPTQLAKLGLLMQNGGSWNGQQVISSDWASEVSQPSNTNPCYGYFFWTNEGKPCTGANIPSAQTYDRHLIPSAPDDLFAMVGALQQNNFMIPSLGITVTWSGVLGDTEPNLSAILSAAPGADLYYNFFRILMRGVEDVHIPDPGPFQDDPLDLDVNPLNYISPAVLLNDLVSSPECNIIFCNNEIPTVGDIENLQEIADVGLGLLGNTI
jgi:CubicO group peptidase (beta-lactamase class C family)